MGSSQDLFCLPIGSFSTEPGLWRVRCLLLECHPFKCQSRWGTTGTAPCALVELKQGPSFPNLCRGYLPQKFSAWNLNIPTNQDKEKENQSQFSSQFSEGCYLRQLLKTTCLLMFPCWQVERWKDISSVEYVNVAWSMTTLLAPCFRHKHHKLEQVQLLGVQVWLHQWVVQTKSTCCWCAKLSTALRPP